MKTFTACLLLSLIGWSAHAQVLFDQTSSVVSGGIASQDFETASNQYDCMAVDEFLVPSGERWTIDSILILGQYSAGATTTTGIRLTFYEDSASQPGPVHAVYAWPSDIDLNGDGDATLIFDCPIELEAGRYWLEARALKTFGGGGGQWYWTRDSIGSGLEFQWKNPPNGFATGCTNFTPISSCVGTIDEFGTAFTIYGCSGGPVIPGIGSDTSFCAGPVLTLDPGNGGLTNAGFQWSTGDSTQTILVDSSGEFRVSVTDPSTNCYSVSCKSIQVFPTPMSDIADTSICQGDQVTFNAFAGNVAYAWHDSTTTGPFYTASTQGWVSVALTSLDNGCVGIDSAFVTVIPPPDPTITGEPSLQVCEGDSTDITTVETFASWQWSTGSDSSTITIFNQGFYYLTVTDDDGCVGSDSIELITIAPPVVDITIDTVQPGWGIRLSASEGFESYVWSTGTQQRRIIASSTGTYSVTVTDQFGCTGVGELFVEITGIDEQEMPGVEVFPNPTSDRLNIQLPQAPGAAASATLLDASGRVVASIPLSSTQNELSVEDLESGYYTLRLQDGDRQRTLPVIIE